MPGAYGTVNDKTIVKYDDAVEIVRRDKLFTEYSYSVEKADGTRKLTRGAYLIVEGGYLRWKCLQCGLRSSSDEDYAAWRKKIESVRKDIECYFGRLKQRFKILRIPNLMTTKEKIDNMMFAIVALQNMMLDYALAATDITRWEVQMNWMKVPVSGEQSYKEVMQSLTVAEEEDIREENDPK